MDAQILLGTTLVLATAALAWLAILRGREVGERCSELEILLLDSDDHVDELERQIEDLRDRESVLAARIDTLAAHQVKSESGVTRHGFSEAIALIEHGAEVDELVQTCGLGTAEARLVEILYGQSKFSDVPESGLDNSDALKSESSEIVVDENLNVIADEIAA